MFAAERREKIKEVLLEHKQINVSALSKLLNVTESTVRKDLDVLDSEGFLQKTHGGATLNGSFLTGFPSIPSAGPSTVIHLQEKKKIAGIAVRLLKPGETIFLGHGTTCVQIAELLREMTSLANITVVTNNLNVINLLADLTHITLISIGGQLSKMDDTPSFFGWLAEEVLKNIFISKAFFTVDAVSLQHGYMVAQTEFVDILHQVIEQASDCYIVADKFKFDKVSLLKLCDLTVPRHIITNESITENYKTYFFEHDIQLYTTATAISDS